MDDSLLHNFAFWFFIFVIVVGNIVLIWFHTPSGKKWLREP